MPPVTFNLSSLGFSPAMPSRPLVQREAPAEPSVVWSAPDYAVHRAWPWRKRLASAAGRRIRALWRRPGERNKPSTIEAAIHWLNQRMGAGGLPSRSGLPPCPGTTAAMVPTLLEFGQLEAVHRCFAWLISTQRADGSFPRAGADHGSLFNTAQGLAALIELVGAGASVDDEPAHRAAEYLNRRLEAEREPCREDADGNRRLRAAIQVACLPGLLNASRHLGSPCWRETVDRIATRARITVDWHARNEPSRLLAHAVDAWIALGELDLAREVMRWLSAAQRRNGAVADDQSGDWGNNELLAHLAAIWYKLGDRERADRALAFLQSQQLANGGWRERWGRQHGHASESAWALKHYLDATSLQVATSFAGSCANLPLTIDRRDGRFVAVNDWLASLEPTATVADIGCGSGRFLLELGNRFQDVRLVGIDPSPTLLQRLPPEIEARRGCLLRIPARDGEFDGVFAVESLEHSLLPERAVSELCRVVRPDGRILIIDKHLARHPLSLHEPWERWFLPETVAGWLAPYCFDIRVRPIAHGPDSTETGLFLAWEGTRAA